MFKGNGFGPVLGVDFIPQEVLLRWDFCFKNRLATGTDQSHELFYVVHGFCYLKVYKKVAI